MKPLYYSLLLLLLAGCQGKYNKTHVYIVTAYQSSSEKGLCEYQTSEQGSWKGVTIIDAYGKYQIGDTIK